MLDKIKTIQEDVDLLRGLRFPNVLFIGVVKAGTTSTAAWLQEQKEICFGKRDDNFMWNKELHFFDLNPAIVQIA